MLVPIRLNAGASSATEGECDGTRECLACEASHRVCDTPLTPAHSVLCCHCTADVPEWAMVELQGLMTSTGGLAGQELGELFYAEVRDVHHTQRSDEDTCSLFLIMHVYVRVRHMA
jgi:hypothetical protein